MERQNICLYAGENEGINCLYRYYWVLRPNYGGLGAKPPVAAEAIGSPGAGPPIFNNFCNFLIKMPHFEAYFSLNFYKNFFLSL